MHQYSTLKLLKMRFIISGCLKTKSTRIGLKSEHKHSGFLLNGWGKSCDKIQYMKSYNIAHNYWCQAKNFITVSYKIIWDTYIETKLSLTVKILYSLAYVSKITFHFKESSAEIEELFYFFIFIWFFSTCPFLVTFDSFEAKGQQSVL